MSQNRNQYKGECILGKTSFEFLLELILIVVEVMIS